MRWTLPSLPLYLRIWFAVVFAIVALTLMLAWLWRVNVEPATIRQIVVRDEEGQVVARASAPPVRIPGQGVEFEVTMADGEKLFVHLPPVPRRHDANHIPARPWFGGRTTYAWLMAVVALAVALGSYPIVRRLTQRLERLQQGVERWGEGDLTVRVPVSGNDETARLARRFNQAAERIEALVSTHKSLLANASHELRSPLARIRVALELMGTQAAPGLRQEISRNIGELDALIDEILLASRLDVRESDLGPVEAVDLVGLAAEEAARTGAELIVAPATGDATVQGVPRLLRRLLRNLLENAMRHGGSGVCIEIDRIGEHFEIRVIDHGPGVPAAARERIFEPFYRLPGASEREGGVGLGLALVRQIVQRHAGSVSCDDAPGGGACFAVALPADAAIASDLRGPAQSGA
ncbi:MAG: ATP-binding protein [Burkholderiaceae bacterium]